MADVTTRVAARLSAAVEPFARRAGEASAEPVKSPRTAVVVGRLLGVALLTCFATGLYSHVLQDPLQWFPVLTRPVGLYRFTQGLHVISGTAAVPLLLAKLWTVYPRLFRWPPVRSLPHLLERVSIAVLVGVSLTEVVIGLLNIVQWYPFPFSFRATHLALAWILIGSLAIHLGVKLPVIARHWRRTSDDDADAPGRVASRRSFVAAVSTATATAVVLTAGQSVDALAPLNVFAPRRMGMGPQGLPVNRTAMQAGVRATATSPEWTLRLIAPGRELVLSRADLLALHQVDAVLPIACVEGWSQSAAWRGVRMADLLAELGVSPRHPLVITSLQERGAFRATEMPPEVALDPLTLVALELNGSTLHVDHGFPARVIAPGRPGVLQTKWLSSIEVTV